MQHSEVVHQWIATVNLSKPVKNLERDFSDGVLVAEIIAHFLPRYISLGNFTNVNSVALKRYNWETLQKLVFRHLNFVLKLDQIQRLAAGNDPLLIETVLFELKQRIDEAIEQGRFRPSNRRSRSTASSRGGSQLNLVQLDDGSYNAKNSPSMCYTSRTSEQNVKNIMQNAASISQPPVLDDFTKDQLIEKLYIRIRHLEKSIVEKNDKINELIQKVEKLVEIICHHENNPRPIQDFSPSSPPSSSYFSDCCNGDDTKMKKSVRRSSSSEIAEALNALNFCGHAKNNR